MHEDKLSRRSFLMLGICVLMWSCDRPLNVQGKIVATTSSHTTRYGLRIGTDTVLPVRKNAPFRTGFVGGFVSGSIELAVQCPCGGKVLWRDVADLSAWRNYRSRPIDIGLVLVEDSVCPPCPPGKAEFVIEGSPFQEPIDTSHESGSY